MKNESIIEVLPLMKAKGYSVEDLTLVENAMGFSKTKNFEKTIEIVKELIKRKYSTKTICAQILEDNFNINKKEIEEKFGKDIYEIILQNEKLKKILSKSKEEKNDIKRRAIISSVENIQSIVLELVRGMIELDKNENVSFAREVMENYVPLANRLGMDRLKKDLAEVAFRILNPKKYEEIRKFLNMSRKEREDFIRRTTKELERELKGKIKDFEVQGREKQIYSIYGKIINRKVPLENQRDHFGVRIIANKVDDCYEISEIINKNHPLIPGTFKDFIKNPKPNGYQSIHFCIKKGEKIVEIQIRTKKMHEIAEEGAASHWAYKNLEGDAKFEKKTAWFKEVMKLENKKSFSLKELKLGLFKDKIYCHTPKGKIISLPAKSSALDFAYKVHAEVGNHSIGALIDGKFAPLKTKLENGNTVEIITNKFQRPRRDWLKFVLTKEAKKAISREVKKIEKIPVPNFKESEKRKSEELENPVTIKEFPNHILSFAKCCDPLPGDEIVGILRSNKRALIHKKNCERIGGPRRHNLKAEWKEILTNPTKIFVHTTDRSGILADILNTISRGGIKVKEANAKIAGNDAAECYFVAHAQNLEELKEVIRRVKKVKGVKKIWLD